MAYVIVCAVTDHLNSITPFPSSLSQPVLCRPAVATHFIGIYSVLDNYGLFANAGFCSIVVEMYPLKAAHRSEVAGLPSVTTVSSPPAGA